MGVTFGVFGEGGAMALREEAVLSLLVLDLSSWYHLPEGRVENREFQGVLAQH